MNILILGAGVVGVTLAQHLSRQGHNVSIIDSNRETIRKIGEKMDVRALHGGISDDHILKQAGLATADLVFAVTSSDETNIVLTLVAHGENPKARLFVRIRGEQYAQNATLWRGDRFGNTYLFNPERAAVDTVVRLMSIPCAIDVIPLSNGDVQLAAFRLGMDSPLVGIPLRDLTANNPLLIVAAEQNGTILLPSGETTLAAGDRIYVTWTAETKLKKVLDFLGIQPPEGRRVVIVGGGRIGMGVAEGLLKREAADVTVIERDLERCHLLADRFPSATIVHGNSTDMALLRDATHNAASLVAATGNQEKNFLLALMADHLGVPRVVPMLDAFLDLAPHHGIDAVVSPKLAIVGEILGQLRKGRVLNSHPMLDGQVHAFMLEIEAGSPLLNVPLAQAEIPKGILVAAVIREHGIMVPNGAFRLLEHDQALIICASAKIEHMDELLVSKAGA